MAQAVNIKSKQNKPKTEAELVSEAFTKSYTDLKPNMKTAIKLCKIVSYDSSPEYLYRLQKGLDRVHENIRVIRGIVNSKLEKSADLIDTAVEKNEDKNSEFRKREPKPFNINANNKKTAAPAITSPNQQQVDSKHTTELKNNPADIAVSSDTAATTPVVNNSQIDIEKQKQIHAALKKEPMHEEKLNGNLTTLRRKLKKNVKKVIKSCKTLKKSPSIFLMIHLKADIDEAEENIIKIEDLINSKLKKISGFIKNLIEDNDSSAKSMLRG